MIELSRVNARGKPLSTCRLSVSPASADCTTTFPLCMYVATFDNPCASRNRFNSGIGTLFFPPTLMPRMSNM